MLQITIKGPIGSGKTTAAKKIVEDLEFGGLRADLADDWSPKRLEAGIRARSILVFTEIHHEPRLATEGDHDSILMETVCSRFDEYRRYHRDRQGQCDVIAAAPNASQPTEAQNPGYLIWNPSHGMPRVPQPGLRIAVAEAMRLAEDNIGERFFVLAPVLECTVPAEMIKVPTDPLQIRTVAQVENSDYDPFDLDDMIPF